MQDENVAVAETEAAPVVEQKQKPQAENKGTTPFMNAILIKTGEYVLGNSFVLPSLNMCLLGEQNTILIPQPNVLAVIGIGNADVKCTKCGYVLAMRIKKQQLQDITIKCPSCGNLNQF